jgi:hypothetical protein
MEKPSDYLAKWAINGHFGRSEWYLLEDRVVLGTRDKKYIPYSFEYFWESLNYFSGWETRQLQELAQQTDFSETQLSEKSLKKKRFYQYIDFQEFTPRKYKFCDSYFGKSHIELQILLPNIFFEYDTNNYKRIQTWAEFWFLGPIIPLIDLEIRSELRQWLFQFIRADAGLFLNDAFPLFDYTKIQPKEWRFIEEDGYSGSEVKLDKDRVYHASWDRGGGGGNYISFENYYTEWQKYSEVSTYERNYILSQLKEALIL